MLDDYGEDFRADRKKDLDIFTARLKHYDERTTHEHQLLEAEDERIARERSVSEDRR